DIVRLVFADWLEEHGQPERAEFIRIQCELEREIQPQVDAARHIQILCATGADPNGRVMAEWQGWAAMQLRERELFLVHAIEWLAGLPGADDSPTLHPDCRVSCGSDRVPAYFEYEFRRGFPELIEHWHPEPQPVASHRPTHELVG